MYLIFTLTDETYSILTTQRPRERAEDERFCLWLAGLNHSYWVAGCAVGAFLGSRFRIDVRGLDFVLTALFAVLVVEQAQSVRKTFPFALGAAAAVVALLVWPQQMLPVSMGLVFAVLLFRSRWGGVDA